MSPATNMTIGPKEQGVGPLTGAAGGLEFTAGTEYFTLL